ESMALNTGQTNELDSLPIAKNKKRWFRKDRDDVKNKRHRIRGRRDNTKSTTRRFRERRGQMIIDCVLPESFNQCRWMMVQINLMQMRYEIGRIGNMRFDGGQTKKLDFLRRRKQLGWLPIKKPRKPWQKNQPKLF
ncbi:hypothetical protein PTTG_11516, partial [Puccinia triticina 1-1 BBBD Race 1]